MLNEQYLCYVAAINDALFNMPLLHQENETSYIRTEQNPPSAGLVPQPLRSAMRYSLFLPGKRLRPVLLLAAYVLVREDWENAIPFACAVEMIHTYSLVHDDLPAIDNDDLRRGKPTNHRVFGEDIAILTGDGLLSLAYETMLSASICHQRPGMALQAMEEISRRSGVRGMIAGQVLDVKLEGTQPREDMIRYIHLHKTADLIIAPLKAGLLLAGGTQTQLEAIDDYGNNLGLAFQIVDDLLDTEGDVNLMGKNVGQDAMRGKLTWPALFGVETSRQDAKAAIHEACHSLLPFGEKAALLHQLAQETLVRVK